MGRVFLCHGNATERRSRVSTETRELLGVLAGALPWLLLVVGLAYSMIAASRRPVAPSRRLRGGWEESARLAPASLFPRPIERLEQRREAPHRPPAVRIPTARRANS
jgi:hypothetical protein